MRLNKISSLTSSKRLVHSTFTSIASRSFVTSSTDIAITSSNTQPRNQSSLFSTITQPYLSTKTSHKSKNTFSNQLGKSTTISNHPNNHRNHHRFITTTTPNSKATPAMATYDQSIDAFPSIIIGSNGHLEPQGSFAENQAQFLEPDEDSVHSLTEKLEEGNIGIVAHYYMDVELQAVLTAVKQKQDQNNKSTQLSTSMVSIADSLAMGDHAVKMCRDNNAKVIVCLGVDFMSESVATIMAKNGFGHIPVYRLSQKHIGCSLAESAERQSYRSWLEYGRKKYGASASADVSTSSSPTTVTSDGVLHVVYINTSLETKAISSSIVPTITCTSSNVFQTLLQASVQLPNLQIFYGPDTYMGENLIQMLSSILNAKSSSSNGHDWNDERISKEIHPQHTRSSLERLRDNIHVYPNGNCVVHHMFGSSVVQTVQDHYQDAFVTAHLEVPGEMFSIAMDKSLEDKGVVGSTSDILKFISKQVKEAANNSNSNNTASEVQRLKFILGTEAGMVTSIVKSVQGILDEANCQHIQAEIIFPVSTEAVTSVETATNASGPMIAENSGGDAQPLTIVPGVPGGEGCSTAGGCATCPFMKMNDLDALNDVVDMVLSQQGTTTKEVKDVLDAYLPPSRLVGKKIQGVDAVDLGSEPILFMREFMNEKIIPQQLVEKIKNT